MNETNYVLEDQVGFMLRQVTQRHLAIFSAAMPEQLTPTQFAAMAKLLELGATPQTQLGRATAMDAATIKGVIDRLRVRGFVTSADDPVDGRLIVVSLTEAGRAVAERGVQIGLEVTRETLAPLSEADQATLMGLLRQLR